LIWFMDASPTRDKRVVSVFVRFFHCRVSCPRDPASEPTLELPGDRRLWKALSVLKPALTCEAED
jgi:hypothetical protein